MGQFANGKYISIDGTTVVSTTAKKNILLIFDHLWCTECDLILQHSKAFSDWLRSWSTGCNTAGSASDSRVSCGNNHVTSNDVGGTHVFLSVSSLWEFRVYRYDHMLSSFVIVTLLWVSTQPWKSVSALGHPCLSPCLPVQCQPGQLSYLRASFCLRCGLQEAATCCNHFLWDLLQ